MKSQKSKDKSAQGTQAHDRPARLDDLLVGDSTAKVPNQVADTVHAVVDEGEGHETLEADLGDEGEGSEGSGHGGGLEVPAQQGSGEICSRVKVQATGEEDTGDTVGTTADPGDLGAVDGKVGRDRAVLALLGKNLSWVGGVGGGGRLSVTVSIHVSISRQLCCCP